MNDQQPQTIQGIRCFSPEVARNYADYPDEGFDLTDELSEDSFWVRSRHRLFNYLVSTNLNAIGKTKVLEIGCGTGEFIRHIAANPSLEITGSDVYLKGLLLARENLPDVDLIQFDVTSGDIGVRPDVVLAFDVIEHIEDDVAAIATVSQMLSVGGRFIVSVPQHTLLWSRLDEIVRHKRRYSKKELTAKLAASGLSVVKSTSFVCALFPLMLLARIFDRASGAPKPDDVGLEGRVTFSKGIDWIFDQVMRLDEALIRLGVALPFGGTLVVVARKS